MTSTSAAGPPTSSRRWSRSTGSCMVQATERRTSVDMAHFLRRFADETYPKATVIVLVMDNLSIHTLACLYEAFPPAEARRLTKRFEVHYTPRHGSWLNVAEIFLSTLAIQCLDQRIDSIRRLRTILTAWTASRGCGRVTWRFTAAAARIKLRRLYRRFRRTADTRPRRDGWGNRDPRRRRCGSRWRDPVDPLRAISTRIR